MFKSLHLIFQKMLLGFMQKPRKEKNIPKEFFLLEHFFFVSILSPGEIYRPFRQCLFDCNENIMYKCNVMYNPHKSIPEQ